MRLSDLVTGGQDKYTASQVKQPVTQSAAQTAGVNRQIHSMAPGQTLQGEVVYRNGNEVQIKLADDSVLNARVDQSINLEVGKNVTFEVRANGGALTLSPLFSNTATDANVLKALGMAALPMNEKTVAMTELMMRAGLPVNRDLLQQVYREINAHQGAALSDIVDLHKLGMPVNEGNLAQIDSYKNLTHQLVEGMHDVLGTIPETIQNMVQEGDISGAGKMFQELLQLVEELPEAEGAAANETQSADTAGATKAQGQDQAQQAGERIQDTPGARELSVAEFTADDVEVLTAAAGEKETDAQNVVPNTQTETGLGEQALEILKDADMAEESLFAEGDYGKLPLSGEIAKTLETTGQYPAYDPLLKQLAMAEEKGDLAGQAKVLQQVLQQATAQHEQPLLEGLLKGKQMQKVLQDGLSKLWTIEPKEVAGEGKVDELYQRLNRQLRTLAHVLEQGGATQSESYKAVSNMTQNLDFLQQLNQAYTYVQLPLRLQQGDAHGDLYVYTNKRNLAAKDGQISALLHLDMEHLGPVDVYVAMQSERVSTRFYVQDDDMLDFLEQHMDILTERLQKRGYQCKFEMTVRESGTEPASGLKGLLAQENGQVKHLGMYAFDMRA